MCVSRGAGNRWENKTEQRETLTVDSSLRNDFSFRISRGRFTFIKSWKMDCLLLNAAAARRGVPAERTCHQQSARGARHAEAVPGEAAVAAGVGARDVGQPQRAVGGQRDPGEGRAGRHLSHSGWLG